MQEPAGGVTWDRKSKKWQAHYKDADGKKRHINSFDDEEEARDSSKGLGVVKRSRTLLSQFFAKLDFIPPRAYDIGGGRYGDGISFLALIVVCAVVIYCVKRNNPASADDADAAMVPADAIANPTLFKRLLNA